MKKRIITIALCVALIACFMVGCASKTPVTADGFVQAMEAAGFSTVDVTEKTETNGLAAAVILAVEKDGKYQLEYYQLNNDDTAEAVFYNNKQLFDNTHSTKTMSSEITTDSYNYYAFTSGGNFHMIARVGNTMLYCDADKACKEDIVGVLETLGYK